MLQSTDSLPHSETFCNFLSQKLLFLLEYQVSRREWRKVEDEEQDQEEEEESKCYATIKYLKRF